LAAIDYRQHCVYTGQTGSLQNPSSEGNNYLLVAYDYDSNFIFYCPSKTKQALSSLQPSKTSTMNSPKVAASPNSTD
jgi:hypothetical protein